MIGNEPLVSVVIPVYNCERYLAEAIESVLAQTYRPIEIIVVDDGSTDGSAQVAKRFTDSVRYCFQANSGTSAARNRGASLASGTFFAFLDADDLWVVDKLTRQMAVFGDDPGLDVVFGHVQQFCSPELDEHIKKTLYCPAEAMPGYLPGAMLIKRDAFLRVGPFETDWQAAEALAWYSRVVEKGLRSLMLSDVVLRRRLHISNKGIDERTLQRKEYLRILKASLDRRRTASRRGSEESECAGAHGQNN
jgi:glycosyltransferase involved in cell wall biosynthesis